MKYPAGSKQIQTGFSCFLTFKLLLFVSLSISVHICRGHTFDTITLEIIEITTHQWMITTHQWYVIQNRMLSQNGTPHYVDSRNTDKQDIQRRLSFSYKKVIWLMFWVRSRAKICRFLLVYWSCLINLLIYPMKLILVVVLFFCPFSTDAHMDFKGKYSNIVKYKDKVTLLLFSSKGNRLTQSPSRLKSHVYPVGIQISVITMKEKFPGLQEWESVILLSGFSNKSINYP